MGSLTKKMKGFIGANIRRKRGGAGITGESGKKFQGSTQYTGITIGASAKKQAGSSSSATLKDPRKPLRIPSGVTGGARTPLSR